MTSNWQLRDGLWWLIIKAYRVTRFMLMISLSYVAGTIIAPRPELLQSLFAQSTLSPPITITATDSVVGLPHDSPLVMLQTGKHFDLPPKPQS